MTDWQPNPALYPRLAETGWHKTSDAEPYNCIAWAAGDNKRAWWPNPSELIYWPDDGGEPTLDVFHRAFGAIGYVECAHGELESGYEKVAIFFRDNEVRHMARQLPTGYWTSKMGLDAIDLSHKVVDGVGGPNYGEVVSFMKRKIA